MGDRKAHIAAMTMMLTYPGVPSIFAGDEIGLEGSWGEDARRTINWSDKSGWDLEFFSEVRNLIKLRRNQDALINGGLRWVVVEDDYLVYLRESKKQSILVFVSRGPVKATIDLNSFGYTVIKTLYGQVVEGEIFSVDSAHSTQGIWIVE
jgi:alpha-glucosidase